MTELTLDQALQKGIEAHKAGQVQEADRLYTAILKAQPKHPDANHNMGVLAVGVGKVQEALPFFKTALEANQSIAQYWLSYIDALIKLERLADAKAVLDQAKGNEAKGDGFDKLEQRLEGVEPSEITVSQNQDPPQDQLQPVIDLYSQRQLQEALSETMQLLKQFPKSVTLYNIQGAANAGLGQLDAAVMSYQQAINIKPDYADAYNNMGVTLKDQGKLEEAIEAYNKALAIKSDYADAYNNMGVTLQKQGKLEEAIDAYNKALAIKPDYADAYLNMGNALKDQGKLKDAIKAYKKALAIKPDFADAYYNMGVALQEQGKFEQAIEAYNKALAIKPDNAAAQTNLGSAFREQGKLEETIKAYSKALAIKPDNAEAYYNMGAALKGIAFTKPSSDLQKVITTILERKTDVRPAEICSAAISLLKFEPVLKKVLQRQSKGQLIQFLHEAVLNLSELPLLLKLMAVCPLADLELEAVLRDIRSGLLFSVSELHGSSEVLRFQSALALQCFTNEYLYDLSDLENKAIQALEVLVAKMLGKGQQPNPHSVLCLASYKALHEYDWCDLLAVTSDIEEVFTRQVMEPRQEGHLKSDITTLKEITSKVSSKVREQYEESPYPRWVNLGLALKHFPISKVVDEVKLRLFDNTINEVEAPNILIAGCGTGQHSIGTAARFKGSKVLAIDLSLSSLAYAKRKTEELGIQNIEYMQADILDLGKLERQFDIVESAGVLHHMDDPMVGWRVLTDCLKQGGLMAIGLYSELARQHIVKMRSEIKKLGIGSTDTAMKSFRTGIIKSDKVHHKQILNSPDFYSLSTLRDLLFHVQEHRFTIPQIKDCLGELGLNFCGFETFDKGQNFKLNNTGANDLYNLDNWHTYEEANPNSFRGMYQFWCQKIV